MTLKPYLKYKESGVEWLGQVPEHWEVMPLKRVAQIQNGKDYKDIEVDEGGYPVLGSGGEFARASQFLYQKESVLLGRKGTIDQPIYINEPFWVVDTMFYSVISTNACAKFVYYLSKTIHFDKYSTNTAVPSMTQEDLSTILFAVPGQEEQTSIATYLDQETACIDELIAQKTRFIELLKEKRSALITHAVTKGLHPNVKMKDSGVEWLGQVPEHWEVKRLKFVATYQNSNVDKKTYDDQKLVRLCNYTDVYYNEFITDSMDFMEATASDSEVKSFSLEQGNIIITKDSEDPTDIGIPAIVAEPLFNVVCGYHLTIIRTTQDNCASFVFRVLQSHPTKAQFYVESPGITRFGLGQDTIGGLSFALPPIAEQTSIATYLDQETARIDEIIQLTEQSISLIKERRSALITAAVTGKIDVSEQGTVGV